MRSRGRSADDLRRQLAQWHPCLVSAQESNAPRRLFEKPYRRRSIEPLPVADTLAQDRPNESERPIYGRIASFFRPPGLA